MEWKPEAAPESPIPAPVAPPAPAPPASARAPGVDYFNSEAKP